MGGGGGGRGGGGARVIEFSVQRIKILKKKKKILSFLGEWGGVGGRGKLKESEFFFTKNPNLKKKKNFGRGWRGGGNKCK